LAVLANRRASSAARFVRWRRAGVCAKIMSTLAAGFPADTVSGGPKVRQAARRATG
jgi:hypothetical protein